MNAGIRAVAATRRTTHATTARIPHSTLAVLLASRRKAQDLAVKDLALLAGISEDTVRRIEADTVVGLPKIDMLRKLARALEGVTLGDLLVGAELATPEELRLTHSALDPEPEMDVLVARADRYMRGKRSAAEDAEEPEIPMWQRELLREILDDAIQWWRRAVLEPPPPGNPPTGRRS